MTEQLVDKYERQMNKLLDNPFTLHDEWTNSRALFGFVRSGVGCLTMLRNDFATWPEEPELCAEIVADERLPKTISELVVKFNSATTEVRREILQPFAEWQRRLDSLFGERRETRA